jgi:hypothetical protein
MSVTRSYTNSGAASTKIDSANWNSSMATMIAGRPPRLRGGLNP